MVVKSKKPAYFAKLVNLLETCPKALIVGVDFVRRGETASVVWWRARNDFKSWLAGEWATGLT